MSRFISLLSGTILFYVGAISMWAQAPSVKEIVLANEKKFSELQIHGECDEAARLLDSEFHTISIGIATKSDGLGCQSGEDIPTSETFSNLDFTLLTPETALVTYKDTPSFLTKRGSISLQAYVASVWVKRDSEWRLGLHTASSIPFAVTEEGKLRLPPRTALVLDKSYKTETPQVRTTGDFSSVSLTSG